MAFYDITILARFVCYVLFSNFLLQVEFYVEVDEVPALGVSAATRATISVTATSDTNSAMNTLVSIKALAA